MFDVYRSFTPNKTTFTKYCLIPWISKLPRSFKIHWVRQYLVNVTGVAGMIQDRANFHRSQAWQIVLIFSTLVYSVYLSATKKVLITFSKMVHCNRIPHEISSTISDYRSFKMLYDTTDDQNQDIWVSIVPASGLASFWCWDTCRKRTDVSMFRKSLGPALVGLNITRMLVFTLNATSTKCMIYVYQYCHVN